MKHKRFIDNAELLAELKEVRSLVDRHNNTTEEPMTMAQAAEFLQMSKTNLEQNYKRLEIPYHKPVGTVYFYKSELNQWIRADQLLKEQALMIARDYEEKRLRRVS